MSIKSNNKQIIVLFKWLVVIGLALVIYYRIYKADNWSDIKYIFLDQLNADKWPYLLLAFGLMPINWLLETQKWHILVKSFEKISFFTAIKAILIGIVMALITPARIGEYAGRLSLLREKSQSLGATLLGSIAQNLVTLLIGLFAVVIFADRFISINSGTKNIYYILIIGAILALSWLYFHMNTVLNFLNRFKFLNKYLISFANLKKYDFVILSKVLGLSLVRYLVYAIQYFLLLHFFGIEGELIVLFAGIAILFLIQSGIPLPPVLSILARGELAIIIWSNISNNTIAAVSVSFSLWIINLIIPALIGLIVMLRSRIFISE